MGKPTAEKLGSLKLGINCVRSEQSTVDKIVTQNPDSATGIGRLKNVTVKLWNDIRAIIQHVILWQIICNNTKSGIMKTGIIRIQP